MVKTFVNISRSCHPSCSSFSPVAILNHHCFNPTGGFLAADWCLRNVENKVISSPPVKSFLSFTTREPQLHVLPQAEAFIIQTNCPRDCFILNISGTLHSYFILVWAPILYKSSFSDGKLAGRMSVRMRLTLTTCWQVDVNEKWLLASRAAFLLWDYFFDISVFPTLPCCFLQDIKNNYLKKNKARLFPFSLSSSPHWSFIPLDLSFLRQGSTV